MVFEHKNQIQKDGCFIIDKKVVAAANSILDKPVLREFWKGFTFDRSQIEFIHNDGYSFTLGDAGKVNPENHSYAINVETRGISVTAKSEKELVWGFMTLLDLIESDNDGTPLIKCTEIKESPDLSKRMIHFCIFPETKLWQAERFIRLCGALKYTHIVLEFWGMYKYDCLKELSWEHAFSKEEIRPLIQTANDLGMEIIPMINHWGHASQCRQIYGKHTVLSQNPKLQYLFCEDGWRWNINNPKTKELLKKVRSELIELCGNGEYFMIGCDEADGFGFSKEETDEICDYINAISNELFSMGRKTIMWADMLLAPNDSYDDIYCTNSRSQAVSDYMLEKLDKKIILADWQYDAKKAPIKTVLFLKEKGFNTLLCPWDRSYENVFACTETAKEKNLYGILYTTWHTLSQHMPHVLINAVNCWDECRLSGQLFSNRTAAVLRKAYPCGGNYEKSGWSEKQIEW